MLDPWEGIAPDGTIVTGVARSRVPPVFEPVLAAAIAAVSGRPDVSLYVYGSVATGRARPGHSDVDLLTVDLPPDAAQRLGAELSAGFAHLCREVAVAPMTAGHLDGDSDQAHGDRVFLRHYCVHLAGPDHARGWPGYRADARAARGFNGDVGAAADRWRAALADGADPGRLGRALARKTLLAVAGLVSVHDGRWTTDRATAARRWGQIRPERAADLDRLLAWSESTALPDEPAVREALDGIVTTTVAEFTTTIGLLPR